MERHFVDMAKALPVLEKRELCARASSSWDCGTSGRWHIHCAIELAMHFDAIALESLIRECWAKVEWGYGRILVRDAPTRVGIKLHVERPPEVRVRRFRSLHNYRVFAQSNC